MANYSTLKAAVADVVKTNGTKAITGANLQSTLISIINSLGTGYQFMGVATPSTSPGTPDYNVAYIGGAGTYANFGTSVVVPPTNIAVFKYNGTWTCEQVTVENGGVFDISAFKAVGGTLATYADLSAALGTYGANVPESVRKGGMSIKFVQTSDNKYVQARCMAQNFTTDVTQWQSVDDVPTAGSSNLVKSGGIHEEFSRLDKEIGSIKMPLSINKFWNNQGTRQFDNGILASDKIKIERGIFSIDSNNILGYRIFSYVALAEDDTLLNYYSISGRTYSIDTDTILAIFPNAFYIGINVWDGRTTAVPSQAQVESLNFQFCLHRALGPRVSTLENEQEETTQELEELNKSIVVAPVNASILQNGILHDNYVRQPTYNDPTNGWCFYEFVVNAGEEFKISSVCGSSVKQWMFFDRARNLLTASSFTESVKRHTEEIVAPTNAHYLTLNCRKGNASEIAYIDVIQYNVERQQANSIFINENANVGDFVKANRLFGKTLVCCGDSITEGSSVGFVKPIFDTFVRKGTNLVPPTAPTDFVQLLSSVYNMYGQIIATRNAMTFYNDGASGTTIEVVDGRGGCFSEPNGRYTTLPDTIDYLLLWFGWNDVAYGTLGTIADTEPTTFYGAWNVVLPYLINKYPTTKIGLVVPYLDNAQWRQAVRDVANKYGLAYFDMFKAGTPLFFTKEQSVGVDSSIVTANRTKFLADGTHPNQNGYNELADMIENWLRSL